MCIRDRFQKEVLRFWKVSFQTVAAPVLTSMLYLLIFGHVLEGRVQVFDRIGYTRRVGDAHLLRPNTRWAREGTVTGP